MGLNISLVVLSLIMGILIGRHYSKVNIKRRMPEKSRIPPPPPKPRVGKMMVHQDHLKPEYYGYEMGSYADCNKCKDCGLTGLEEDIHTSSCCPRCGGDVRVYKALKWGDNGIFKKWVNAHTNKAK